MTAGRVLVVGGGLAGIAAALACADAGRAVTLLESRSKLGGLTHSFRHGDLDVDNGQHVFLRCCVAYRGLLKRLGVEGDVMLQDRLDIPVRSPWTDKTSRLRRTGLPAPAHLGGSLLRYSQISLAQRLRFALAALAMRRLDRNDPAVDRRSFADWLTAHKQDQRTVDALWDLIGIATLNARAADASLSLAAMVFQVGLLTDASAADIGWSLVPLQRLHGDAAALALEKAGVVVELSATVDAIEPRGAGWAALVRTRDGSAAREHVADELILATPPSVAERLAPGGAFAMPSGWSAQLGSSPIINLHVVFDREVMSGPFVAGVGTPIQWVFDRTRQSGLNAGQYVAVSVSAAHDLNQFSVAELRERLLPDLIALLPAARGAQMLDFFVTREPNATFRAAPGSGALRPGSATGLPGLYVAGAWTDTGWPATMEGAVRSGDAAARALLARPLRQDVSV
jgi:hydroxysqualene dehydroxylase